MGWFLSDLPIAPLLQSWVSSVEMLEVDEMCRGFDNKAVSIHLDTVIHHHTHTTTAPSWFFTPHPFLLSLQMKLLHITYRQFEPWIEMTFNPWTQILSSKLNILPRGQTCFMNPVKVWGAIYLKYFRAFNWRFCCVELINLVCSYGG